MRELLQRGDDIFDEKQAVTETRETRIAFNATAARDCRNCATL
jgi:hypothetical protein